MATPRAEVDTYAAISDRTRRSLLLRLAREGERSVSELLEPLPISQPAVSRHLRVLRQAGLVRSRKEGRARLYSLQAEKLREVSDWVALVESFWDERLNALGEYLDKTSLAEREH